MSLWFEHPFTCVISGPTKSGKTCFIKNVKLITFFIKNEKYVDKINFRNAFSRVPAVEPKYTICKCK